MKKLIIFLILTLIFSGAAKLYSQEDDYLKAIGLLDQGKYEESLSFLQKHLEVHAEDANAYLALGLALNKMKEYKKAKNQLCKSLKLNPVQASTYFALALVNEKLKNYSEAIENWSKFRYQTSDKNLKAIAEKHISLLEDINE